MCYNAFGKSYTLQLQQNHNATVIPNIHETDENQTLNSIRQK